MNIIDDVIAMQKVTLEQTPFNNVDSLVFSTLSYFAFEQVLTKDKTPFADIDGKSIVVPEKIGERYQNHYRLLKAVVSSERYKDFVISNYENIFCHESEKQFAAVCFANKNFVYVAFRGTDATITGWKEDANMSFMKSVPAQEEAVLYLKRIAKQHKKKRIVLGGHSKGGNLAIYAAAKSSWLLQRKIDKVFCHDGPGFCKEFFWEKGYKKISPRIEKTVPPSSIIGMLLENPTPYQVVDSEGKSIFQHNPYLWLIQDHNFVPVEQIKPGWMTFNESLNKWLQGITVQKRKEFIDLLFDFFDTAEITDFRSKKEMLFLAFKNRKALIEKYKNLDEETQEFFGRIVKEIFGFVWSSRKIDKKS